MGTALMLAASVAPGYAAPPASGPPATAPAPKGSPTRATPAADPATKAAAAPATAAPPPGSAVFFTIEGSPEHGPLTLVPLHCYDKTKQVRAVGDSCLPLLPAGAMVETAGGPLQLGEPVMPQCPRQPLMGGRRLIGKVKPLPFLYGAWPSLQAARYVAVPEQNLGGAMAPIEKLARQAITAATAMPVADLSIYQIIALSLAGTRPFQKVYSVAVPDRRGHTVWSGLLIGDAQSRAATVAGDEAFPGVKQHSMQIVGHTDVDHDGKLELIVNTGGDNLDRYSVRAYDGAKLPVVSYWHSCN
jgi:hypothetical protein